MQSAMERLRSCLLKSHFEKELQVFYVVDLMENWLEKYNLAKAYYEHHGNLNIPSRFKTSNGYEPDPNGTEIGTWILSQKKLVNGTKRGKISEQQIELLKQIGMDFSIKNNDDKWNEMYELAKKYYDENGDLNMPYSFKDENGIAIGRWVHTQRQAFQGKNSATLDEKRIYLLKQIGMKGEDSSRGSGDQINPTVSKNPVPRHVPAPDHIKA